MILCADDYGLRDDVNGAILELAASGRLSAVSCMAVLERCTPEAMARLRVHESRLDIGLHLCLTDEGLPLAGPLAGTTLPRFGNLLRRSLSGWVRPAEIAALIAAQYNLFVEKCGRKPDYIDGHLHAHQLPGIAEGLARFVASLPVESRPYVRNTRMSLRELRRRRLPWLKSLFIGAFGARMRRRLHAAALPTNDGFAGIYDFRCWRNYGDYFPGFTACLSAPNGLLVVHPGHDEDWRRQEAAVLRQFPFPPGTLNRFQTATGNR